MPGLSSSRYPLIMQTRSRGAPGTLLALVGLGAGCASHGAMLVDGHHQRGPHFAQAATCADQADANQRGHRWWSTLDIGLLALSGLSAVSGTALSAAAGLPFPDDAARSTHQQYAVTGAVLLASAGAILGLRALIGPSEIARVNKIASAQRRIEVDRLLRSEAPAEAWRNCQLQDEEIAKAYPGLSEPSQRLADQQRSLKKEILDAVKAATTSSGTLDKEKLGASADDTERAIEDIKGTRSE